MSTSHRYNTRSKTRSKTTPKDKGTTVQKPFYCTRSTNKKKAGTMVKILCNEAKSTSFSKYPNARIEKMIKLMIYIRTHKIMLAAPSFKSICFSKCHSFCREMTRSVVLKRVKSKLLKSLKYECTLLLHIIESEFWKIYQLELKKRKKYSEK